MINVVVPEQAGTRQLQCARERYAPDLGVAQDAAAKGGQEDGRQAIVEALDGGE